MIVFTKFAERQASFRAHTFDLSLIDGGAY